MGDAPFSLADIGSVVPASLLRTFGILAIPVCVSCQTSTVFHSSLPPPQEIPLKVSEEHWEWVPLGVERTLLIQRTSWEDGTRLEQLRGWRDGELFYFLLRPLKPDPRLVRWPSDSKEVARYSTDGLALASRRSLLYRNTGEWMLFQAALLSKACGAKESPALVRSVLAEPEFAIGGFTAKQSADIPELSGGVLICVEGLVISERGEP